MSRLVPIIILLLSSLICKGQSISDTLSVTIIGDVMMHSRQLEHNHHSFIEKISKQLKASDFSVANMEFSIGGQPYSGYPAFSTPDWYADYVASQGINVFLTANNHVLDKGTVGLEKTLEKYRSMADSVHFTGSSSNEDEMSSTYPLILFEKGISIALINFTYGTNVGESREWPKVNRIDKDRIAAAIQNAKERQINFIIALPHWGVEYDLLHSKDQEDLANWLVEQGVDAIVGSHPHVVQDTMHIGSVPVIYSIGNAVSNMSAKNTRLELAVTLRFTRQGDKKEMLSPELRFMWCTLPNMLTNSYATIFVDEYIGRRHEWINPYDYDNMVETLKRVCSATGIEYEKDN